MKPQQTPSTNRSQKSALSTQKSMRDNFPLSSILYLLSSIFYLLRFASIFILVIYTLLTLILTYPLVFNLSITVPNDIGDPLLNTWILAWDSHALLTDPLNLFKANIFYPLPNTLAYSEHLFSTALLALPLQLISAEPIVAYNLSLLATFPLAAFGMYLLILRWTRQRSAAFIAGLIFAFAPYRFAAIAHLQLLTFQWLPFVLLSLDMMLDKKGSSSFRPEAGDRKPIILMIFLILQLLASWYLALYTIVIVGVYLLIRLVAGQLTKLVIDIRGWLILIFIFLISISLALPFAWPYLSLLDDLRAARPLSLALSMAATPTDFAAAAPFNRLFGPLTAPLRTRPGFTEENTLFVGFITPLLALVSVIALVVRVGSSVWSAVSHAPCYQRHASEGTQTSRLTSHVSCLTLYALLLILLLSLTLTFPTPYTTLANLFPLSTLIRVPPRWIIPALFALAGLAAFGYADIRGQRSGVRYQVLRLTPHVSRLTLHAPRLTPHASRLALHLPSLILLLTCTALLLETFSVPLPLAPVENRITLNPAYHWLAAQPGDVALIELPLHSAPAPEYPEVKRLYASTLGWWKLVNGYSGYTPPRQPELAQALTDFPDTDSITTLQNLAPPLSSLQSEPQKETSSSNLPTFQPSLFLLVHPGEAPFDRIRWESTDRWQVERNPALRPISPFVGDYLYQVLPSDPTRFAASPLAAFGQDKNVQLLAYDLSSPHFQSSTFTQSVHPSREAFILLYWQPTSSLPTDYTIFIHLRAPDGFIRSQADGPPVNGHYPTTAWQSGEVIQDVHPWLDVDLTQIDHLAIGLYDPATGERLLAFGPDGQRLAEDALIIPLVSR